MAQRFGGKFSPGSAPEPNSFDGRQPAVPTGRITLMFVVSLAFVWAAFTGNGPRDLVLGLSAFGLTVLSAWLTRDGLTAAAAYNARRVARKPAIPRKAFGAVLMGMALGVGGMMGPAGMIYAILFGLLGAGLHIGAFGLDPWANKGMEGIDDFQSDRVAKAVDEGEAYLRAMKDATLRANDRKVAARVDTFATAARAMFRSVENDPRDLTAARKYLSVYLMGARDAAVKFADLYAQTRDAQALSDFDALLTDLETHFAARTQTLLSDNRTDLDVEISVLRERLQRET
jgi:5-bromo-4-chloroindolyl phosphate hydrolysis protein